jgi:hypothetical protein
MHFRRILAAAHQDDAFHRGLLIVHAEDARGLRRTDLHRTQVMHEHRHAFDRGHYYVLNVADGLNQPHPANHHGLLLVIQQRSARVLIVRIHCLCDLSNRQPILVQRKRIDHNLVLLDEPAERSEIRDTIYLKKARSHDPILNLAQTHGIAIRAAVHRVSIEFADRSREGTECRCDPLRNVGIA